MNPLWLIVLLGGGALYFSKLKHTGESLSVTILNIHSFKIVGGAVQVGVNIALDNPTGTSLTIKQPNVKIYYDDNEAGNSIPNNKQIDIKKNDRTPLDTIFIQIPFSNMPGIVLSLLNRNGEKNIAIDVEVNTTVNGLPISQRKTFSV
jgi:hypothetical protein